MNKNSSNKGRFPQRTIDPRGRPFADLISSADAFICAAGFEERTRRAPMAAKVKQNPLLVKFINGPAQNDATLRKFLSKFHDVPGFDVCELNAARTESFESEFEKALRRLKNLSSGRILMDISGLPSFAICVCIIKIRHVFPTATLTLLYTEAEDYFPRKMDFERIKRAARRGSADLSREYLTARAVNMFMPSMFSGLALGHNDTCLIVLAGFEPHRTECAIQATNPSKLVMVYGKPDRRDLQWRLELAKIMHSNIDEQLTRTEEVVSSFDIGVNLKLLMDYYDHLYDDHILSVCPIHSKMQAVASALAWETYPDIQLTFPFPVEYFPTRFSVKCRDTFIIELGVPPLAARFRTSNRNSEAQSNVCSSTPQSPRKQ